MSILHLFFALYSPSELLDDIPRLFENIIGYRKEIDHALERIAAIEKDLGLKPKHA